MCLRCTFRASCCNTRLSRAQVLAITGFSVQDKKKRREGVRGDHLHWRLQGSTSSPIGSVAGGGCFEVLWNLELPVGNLGSLLKIIIVELRGGFEFSRLKVARIGPKSP